MSTNPEIMQGKPDDSEDTVFFTTAYNAQVKGEKPPANNVRASLPVSLGGIVEVR